MSEKLKKYEQCEDCPSKGKGVFCDLEAKALNDLSHKKVTNIFKKGQTLFVQGSPPYGLYCVSKGNIKISKTSSDGKESIVRIATDGDILGHRSLFTEQNFTATATAVEDTSVCFIDKKYIMKLVEQEPSMAYQLISKLGRELGAAENKVASFIQKNVFERTCEVLLLLKESHGEKVEGKTKIVLKITREELASIVGTATESLIRILTELKNEKAISQEGKTLVIEDEEKLLSFANLNG